ncbi:FAD-binding domain-containing protein [Zymoseptoria brevis]|uniref:FAD-binding domain-containing protein n=1 Tax=Zymoseptoria brevis TaxID=1047168 RepID=A0A0F4GN99_9PEZI|nr:FAD-binding domain-containing protein [Zymoseptoria brevis]
MILPSRSSLASTAAFILSIGQVYAAPTTEAAAACRALSNEYPKQVANSVLELNLTLSSNYFQARQEYWSQANADIKPACIFFPGSAQEVSFAVKVLNNYPSVPWTVKGAGHNPNVQFSSVQDGILISLEANMKYTTLDDRNIAHVGAGCRWTDVANVLDQSSRAVVSGRLGVVGVPGLTMGGGLSFLSAEHGMTADNVESYQVVTAAGEIVEASKDENSDLWYAMKGGGGQFGIVTEFRMATYPIGLVWGGYKIFSMSQKDKVINATHTLVGDYYDTKAAVIVTYTSTLDSLVDIFVVFFFYNAPDGPGEILNEFNSIPALVDGTKPRQTYGQLLDSNSQFSLPGQRYLIRTGTLPNLPGSQGIDLYTQAFDSYFAAGKKAQLETIDNFIFSMAFQPIPHQLQANSVNNPNGVNLLGFNPDHGDKVIMEYDVSWLSALTDKKAAAYLTAATEPAQQYAKSKYAGVKPTNYKSGDLDTISYNPIFMNDAMYNQDPLRSYGAATYDRLKQIQRERDPNGLFSKRAGGFKFT